MQWHAITKSNDSKDSASKIKASDMGYLPEKQTKVLIVILRKYTKTPGDCCFAKWDGWGSTALDKLSMEAAHILLPGSRYYLIGGFIEVAAQFVSSSIKFKQSANIWQTEDRAWCVATEVDMVWTIIGGSRACIDEIIKGKHLEARQTSLDGRVDINRDQINAG